MGLAASMLWWEEGFCRLLADGGRFVIRYDHRDTGRSVTYEPGRPEYTSADRVDDWFPDRLLALHRGSTLEEPKHKEVAMAVVYIQEFPIEKRSTTNYDWVKEQVGDGPFEGLICHTAGFDDDGGVFRILDVWETREAAEQFLAGHVQPLMENGPSAFPDPTNFTEPTRDGFYELHDVITPATVGAATH